MDVCGRLSRRGTPINQTCDAWEALESACLIRTVYLLNFPRSHRLYGQTDMARPSGLVIRIENIYT